MNTKIALLGVAITSLALSGAWAQTTRSKRPSEPLILSDFERPEAVALWTGLPCERTDRHSTRGMHGMRFTFPEWKPGMNEWPSVSLAYADGKGYATKDWSAYSRLAFEAWIEGNSPEAVAVEVRDRKGRTGATHRFTITPRETNYVHASLAELGEAIRLTNVEEIVFLAARPARDFTITIDNLRLVPGPRLPLAEFDLVYPNYRGLVFPDGGDVEVEITFHAEEYDLTPEQLYVRLNLLGDLRPTTTQRAVRGARQRFSISLRDWPYGPSGFGVGVFRVADNVHVAGEEWPIYRMGSRKETWPKVYIDRANNTIVDGKPFFPLGWYGAPDEEHLAEIADSPFNCLLAYGTNLKPRNWMTRYLDEVHNKGLKLIYCMNDVYPTATYLDGKGWEGITGNDRIADAVIRAYKDHPAILAWYLNDELPGTLVPQLENYYDVFRKTDPNHPCYVVLCNMAELKRFRRTTDIFGVDPYPIPHNPVTMVAQWADAAHAAVKGRKPIWLVPQAFAWYQYRPEGSDRGRKPTAEELKTGRAPTCEESRCMTYLALAHGAKGLIYYCYYDLRVLPQYAEMRAWMKKIGGEVKELFPVLLSPEDLGPVDPSPPDPAIHTKLKRSSGRLYLIAVNAADEPRRATFDLKQPLPPRAGAMFEGRTVPTDGTRLTAEFKPLEARVFEFGPVSR